MVIKFNQLSISSYQFREITNSFKCKSKLVEYFSRSLIRYPIRLIGERFGVYYLLTLKCLAFRDSYLIHIITVNNFSLRAKNFIINNKFNDYVLNKEDWIEYILNNSNVENDLFVAKYYRVLLDAFVMGDAKGFISNSTNSFEDYYVYGPNSNKLPELKRKQTSLVLTKYPTFDVSNFTRISIFLNSYSADQLDSVMFNELLKKYEIVLKKTSYKSKAKLMLANPESELASSMGLNRIIRHLLTENKGKVISIKLDGFDLYTNTKVFSGKILSAVSEMDLNDQNKMVVNALWRHDFLYNFIELKDLASKFNLTDSLELCNIINLTPREYWESVIKRRV
jgi:hypothetical protein